MCYPNGTDRSFALFVVDPLRPWLAKADATRFNALASSTRRNVNTQLRAFLLFCAYYFLQPFPVHDELLISYIQYLSENFRAVGSVKNYVFGLQTFSLLKGWSFPDLSNPLYKFQFKGLSRQLAHTPSRAQPISPMILESILSCLNLEDPYHATMWGIMVLGFLLFARIGNLLPSSRSNFDKNKLLTRSDIFMAEDCVVVILAWTKTIQLSERTLQIPLYINQSSKLCPKNCLLNMVSRSPGQAHDLLFTYKSSSGLKVITQSEFTLFLRSCLRHIGLQGSIYSGHSLRRGGATWAFSKGVPGELIKHHGDWRSEAYLVYLDFSFKDKMATTRTMLS